MGLKTLVTDKIPFYNSLILPYHAAKSAVTAVRYGFPAKKVTVIGVTGTNGKTSTCFMIWKMLNESGRKAGLLTTVAWGGVKGIPNSDEEGLVKQIEHMTTADVVTLNKRMKQIVEAGAEFIVLEVTSHALAQYRIWGVPIEIAVLTNVTHEHLDYHKTFERYREAKQKLFKKAKFGVVNADDKSAVYFLADVKKYITYGIKRGQLRAKEVSLAATGVEYKCGDMKIRTRVPGEFTVYNSLAAVAVGQKLGLTGKQIEKGIYALRSVEGRMNRVEAGQDFEVIVDYAHTPDAVQKVFDSVLPYEGQVITVTGGAGRRDESTRAERGEICARNSDVLIITEDDSRDEDPAEIAQMFVDGASEAGAEMGESLLVELDRRKAIKKALTMAKAGDLVLILGKGHEKTILRADGAHDFEDLKVAKELLEEMKE